MRVKLTYQPAQSVEFPAGRIELDPSLDIDLAPDDEDDNFIAFEVSATVTVAFSSTEPVRLLALFGGIGDLANWQLAPLLIGEKLWAEAMKVVGQQVVPVDVVVEVDEAEVLACQSRWTELRETGTSHPITPLPLQRRRNDVEIAWSDPEFGRRTRRFIDWLLGPPGQPPPKW